MDDFMTWKPVLAFKEKQTQMLNEYHLALDEIGTARDSLSQCMVSNKTDMLTSCEDLRLKYFALCAEFSPTLSIPKQTQVPRISRYDATQTTNFYGYGSNDDNNNAPVQHHHHSHSPYSYKHTPAPLRKHNLDIAGNERILHGGIVKKVESALDNDNNNDNKEKEKRPKMDISGTEMILHGGIVRKVEGTLENDNESTEQRREAARQAREDRRVNREKEIDEVERILKSKDDE